VGFLPQAITRQFLALIVVVVCVTSHVVSGDHQHGLVSLWVSVVNPRVELGWFGYKFDYKFGASGWLKANGLRLTRTHIYYIGVLTLFLDQTTERIKKNLV
jgi:hypothetical protein